MNVSLHKRVTTQMCHYTNVSLFCDILHECVTT